MNNLRCLIAAIIIGTGVVIGCATTPIQSTIKVEGVLITSVDTGMLLWRDSSSAQSARA